MKKKSFFFGVYGMLWRVAIPILKRHHRLREGFEERLVPAWWPYRRPSFRHNACVGTEPVTAENCEHQTRRIWIQAASGGEALLVEALVVALQEQSEAEQHLLKYTLLCTTCTRQGLDVLERLAEQTKNSSCVCIVPAYFPLDIPKTMEVALQQAQPELIVLLETELWPGLLLAAHNAQISVAVINGRMTKKSASGYQFARRLLQKVAPTRIIATSDDSAARFATLFGRQLVTTMPNIKFDIAFSHLFKNSLSLEPVRGIDPQTPLAVFASTRQEEEALLLEAIQELLANKIHGVPVKVVIAPRHMHRVPAWSVLLEKEGISYALCSSLDDSPTGQSLSQVLIWDFFGKLPQLYSMADAVFVGGSMAPLGGQNFLEPLAQGRTPFMGPSCFNFAWVGNDISQQGLLVQVETASQLAAAMLGHMQASLSCAPEEWPACRAIVATRVKQDFKTWITPHRGGAKKAALTIVQMISKKSGAA